MNQLKPSEGVPVKSILAYREAGRQARGIGRGELQTHRAATFNSDHLLDKSMNIKELQTCMGHKNLSSTGIYLKATDAQASATASRILKEAV